MHSVDTKKTPLLLKVANFFGAFGYISVLLEWAWVIGIIVYPFIVNGSLNWLTNPTAEPQPIPEQTMRLQIDPTAGIIIGVIVTIICIALVVYALFMIPKTLGRGSAAVTRSAAHVLVPAMTHQKHTTKKSLQRLTSRVMTGIKLTAISLPVVASYMVAVPNTLSREIIIICTLFFGGWSLFNFIVQYIVAKSAQLDFDLIW